MRRVLIVLAALVVVAGVLIAGALGLHWDDEYIVNAEVHCVGDDDCGRVVDDKKGDICSEEGVDGVRVTIIYERPDFSRGAVVEDGRRTYRQDC